MKRSEFINLLLEQTTHTSDPEITFWVSETEQLVLLSVYTSYNDKKICIDLKLE